MNIHATTEMWLLCFEVKLSSAGNLSLPLSAEWASQHVHKDYNVEKAEVGCDLQNAVGIHPNIKRIQYGQIATGRS